MNMMTLVFFDPAQLLFALPELVLFAAIVVVLLLGLVVKNSNISYYLSQFSLLITIASAIYLFEAPEQIIFYNHFIFDALSITLKVVICLLAMMFLLYSRYYLTVHRLYRGEYFVLSLIATFGVMVMMSAYSLVTIYLGLELLSLALYTLIAIATTRIHAIEASFKYFVLGAIASGLLLYGMSMLYGIGGSLHISDIANLSQQSSLDARSVLILNFALVFIVIGVAFKLGAVPFHMWLPDVYQGAPTPVTMLLTTIPKIAVFVITIRILVDALAGLFDYWQDLLMILAILSIGIGSVIAIVQRNLKRLLAYSTIAHIGFILLGLATGVSDGYSASLFYLLVYSLVGLSAFGVIIAISRKSFEADNIDDYQGLAKKQPWLAAMMLMVMLSMAGVPPFIGFYSKFYVLQQVLQQGFLALAIFAVVFSVIAAFYYLKVIRVMFFSEDNQQTSKVVLPLDMKCLLLLNAVMIIVLSLWPNTLMTISQRLL